MVGCGVQRLPRNEAQIEPSGNHRSACELIRPITGASPTGTSDGLCRDTLAAETCLFPTMPLRDLLKDMRFFEAVEIANRPTCISFLPVWACRANACRLGLYSGMTMSRYIPVALVNMT